MESPEEKLAMAAYAVGPDDMPFAEAQQSARECIDLFKQAGQTRMPTAYEVTVLADARLYGRWFVVGEAPKVGDWRGHALAWAKART
jgi:hypothetical protein